MQQNQLFVGLLLRVAAKPSNPSPKRAKILGSGTLPPCAVRLTDHDADALDVHGGAAVEPKQAPCPVQIPAKAVGLKAPPDTTPDNKNESESASAVPTPVAASGVRVIPEIPLRLNVNPSYV